MSVSCFVVLLLWFCCGLLYVASYFESFIPWFTFVCTLGSTCVWCLYVLLPFLRPLLVHCHSCLLCSFSCFSGLSPHASLFLVYPFGLNKKDLFVYSCLPVSIICVLCLWTVTVILQVSHGMCTCFTYSLLGWASYLYIMKIFQNCTMGKVRVSKVRHIFHLLFFFLFLLHPSSLNNTIYFAQLDLFLRIFWWNRWAVL